MIKIEWLPKAHANLDEIVDYLEINTSVNITSFLVDLESTINRLKTFPELGKKVLKKPKFRQLLYKKYRIIYEFKKIEDKVIIILIIHGSRILSL